ncbi:hypothetical protein QF028_003000 [Neobacillus sp. B4I6]
MRITAYGRSELVDQMMKSSEKCLYEPKFSLDE